MSQSALSKQSSLRSLPSIDRLLKIQPPEVIHLFGVERITALARKVIDQMRDEIQQTEVSPQPITKENLLTDALERLARLCELERCSGLHRVINATGVIIHTNLGRAPLSAAAKAAVSEAAGYCTLEYDTNTGSRGRRGQRVEELLQQLTGAEDALVVNNCASAALLVLTVLARDGETLISRGELVEIGGDFRVPDVMANSGTRMVEVGTTNRTKLTDYRSAIQTQTRLIIRVHPSNYRIVGFTATPSLSELAILAHEAGLFLYEDAGSGVLEDLTRYGLIDEPIIRESIQAGADVVTFSGDKLLGSAQAGLIVGRETVVGQLRRHSLYRALRADKLCLAALQSTLEAHVRGTAVTDLPVLRMLASSAGEIEARASNLLNRLSTIFASSDLRAELIPGVSAIGGGSGPNTHPATVLIALSHKNLSADALESKLRGFGPPVIGRIADDRVLLDLRTVEPAEESELLEALTSLVR